MPRERIVAVTYQANENYAKINTDVLGADATVVFAHQAAEQAGRARLRR
jgi:hypothetical protein